MKKNIKGQGLPLNTIVIAILVIIVLLVIVIFFTTKMDSSGDSLDEQGDSLNKCSDTNPALTMYSDITDTTSSCTGDFKKVPFSTNNNNTVCCVKK